MDSLAKIKQLNATASDSHPQKSVKIAWSGVAGFFARSVGHNYIYLHCVAAGAAIHDNWHCHAGGILCYHD